MSALRAIIAFEQLTAYPLTALLEQAGQFLRQQAAPIRRAFEAAARAGASHAPPQLPRLRQLRAELLTTAARLEELRAGLPTMPAWDLLLAIEELATALTSLEQLPRYLRLPTAGGERHYTTGRYQTLEQVAELAGSSSPDAWAQLALYHDLGEDDYSPAGGTRLTLEPLAPSATSGRVQVVLGPQNGELALGRDLPARVALDPVRQDLVVLTPVATADQTLDILLGRLRRGSLPWNPHLGPRLELLVGGNQNLLGLPTVLRQLGTLLATDDTIDSFELVQVRQENDGLFLDLTITFAAGPIRSYALKSI